MSRKEIIQELLDALSNLEPNVVVSLSDEAGRYLIETVSSMKKNGDI